MPKRCCPPFGGGIKIRRKSVLVKKGDLWQLTIYKTNLPYILKQSLIGSRRVLKPGPFDLESLALPSELPCFGFHNGYCSHIKIRNKTVLVKKLNSDFVAHFCLSSSDTFNLQISNNGLRKNFFCFTCSRRCQRESKQKPLTGKNIE